MAKGDEGAQFRNLTFQDFRRMAVADDLSDNERVGFPDSYREAAVPRIMVDIATKLPDLAADGGRSEGVVVDIGCGCGGLAEAVQARAIENGHALVLIDSAEMLARNPDGPRVEKVAAQFPEGCDDFIALRAGACSAVLAYSVLQHTLNRPGVFEFVDAASELLAPGGRLLLADIPNASMRRRFLASEAGRAYHREHYGDTQPPAVEFNTSSRGEMDDAVVAGILGRARAAGYHAWVVPQHPDLPMANRREDILIARP